MVEFLSSDILGEAFLVPGSSTFYYLRCYAAAVGPSRVCVRERDPVSTAS